MKSLILILVNSSRSQMISTYLHEPRNKGSIKGCRKYKQGYRLNAKLGAEGHTDEKTNTIYPSTYEGITKRFECHIEGVRYLDFSALFSNISPSSPELGLKTRMVEGEVRTHTCAQLQP